MIGTALLILHIISGYLALICGAWAMGARKGSRHHRRSGKLYFFSILTVALSAIALALIKHNLFFLLIGGFVLYQCLNGYLALLHPRLNLRWYSPLLWLLGLFTAAGMFISGNPVLIAFGLIQSGLLLQDLYVSIKIGRDGTAKPKTRLSRHLGQMIGSYIGAFTAFLVINIQLETLAWQLLIWLGPTLLFAPYIAYWMRKVGKPKFRQTILILLFLGSSATQAQDAHTRHRFAQSYVGAFVEQWPAAQQNTLGLSIGALHFWGHADFQLDIPVLYDRQEGWQGTVRTAFKYYPWALKEGSLRPYLGLAWQPIAFREGEGPQRFMHQMPLLTGLTYRRGACLWGLDLHYLPNRELAYPIAPNTMENQLTPGLGLGLSVKYSFDLTLSAEAQWQSGYTQRLTDTLAKLQRLDSWTIGLGPSSAFYPARSGLRSAEVHLPNPQLSVIFPELTFGYYWHQPDLQIQLAYRYFKASQSAYGDALRWQRHSLALEAYHFFADYHGFAPFIGGGMSGNSHRESGTIRGELLKDSRQSILPHLTVGWDIRPNRLQGFYLRTHLRWTFATGALRRAQWPLAQLEVNFIEAVFLLDR